MPGEAGAKGEGARGEGGGGLLGGLLGEVGGKKYKSRKRWMGPALTYTTRLAFY